MDLKIALQKKRRINLIKLNLLCNIIKVNLRVNLIHNLIRIFIPSLKLNSSNQNPVLVLMSDLTETHTCRVQTLESCMIDRSIFLLLSFHQICNNWDQSLEIKLNQTPGTDDLFTMVRRCLWCWYRTAIYYLNPGDPSKHS